MLNEGEFVVPKDVSSWLGEKFLQNLINKARTEEPVPRRNRRRLRWGRLWRSRRRRSRLKVRGGP
jgi:hypothetical protein